VAILRVLCATALAISVVHASQQAPAIPRAVDTYARLLEALMGAAPRKPTVENVLGTGRLAAETLAGDSGVLEDLGEDDYQMVVQKMTGFLVSRDEVVHVEPNPDFFIKLAQDYGKAHDVAFFQRYKQTIPNGVWHVYIRQQTDYSGCVRFGSLALVESYQRWTAFRQQFPKQYLREVEQLLVDLDDTLVEETCACGSAEDVAKELSAFVRELPGAEITPRARDRLEKVKQGTSDITFRCTGGTER
jgi:hypothetical protein